MSLEISAFLEKVATDPSLQEALAKLPGSAQAEDLVEIAKSHGFPISVEDAAALLAGADAELSDAALETVNGGASASSAQLAANLAALTKKAEADQAIYGHDAVKARMDAAFGPLR